MRHAILALLLFFLIFPARAEAPHYSVEGFTLANGLEVIVVRNARVPAVSHMLWFRIGAADDPPFQSGLAHFHEHLMFKGSPHFKQGEYERLIARHGGTQNAFTGYDATAYYVTIAKEYLPMVMALEADRMRGLTVSEAETEKEREVIIEERRMRIENNPGAQLGEQMRAMLYLNHPYHFPSIGWKHEMATLTREEVLAFHRAYYHPNNAVLVLSGDITAAEAKKLAARYYGALPKHPVPARVWKTEPPHIAARMLTLSHPNVKQPEWARDYMAPSLIYGDKTQALPLLVLAHIVGGGTTGEFYQKLVVEQKLATSVSASYDGFTLGPAEFSLSAVPAEGVRMETLQNAIEAAIATVKEKGISDQALARAKTLLKAESLYAREGLQSMAYILGTVRALGLDKDYFTRWPEMIEAVTREEVNAAAKSVFVPEASVTGVLLPAEGKPHVP